MTSIVGLETQDYCYRMEGAGTVARSISGFHPLDFVPECSPPYSHFDKWKYWDGKSSDDVMLDVIDSRESLERESRRPGKATTPANSNELAETLYVQETIIFLIGVTLSTTIP